MSDFTTTLIAYAIVAAVFGIPIAIILWLGYGALSITLGQALIWFLFFAAGYALGKSS